MENRDDYESSMELDSISDCSTAQSIPGIPSELEVTIKGLLMSVDDYTSATQNSASDVQSILRLQDQDLYSIDEYKSTERSGQETSMSLTSLHSSLFTSMVNESFESVKMRSSTSINTISFNTSEVQTRFDDDYSDEYSSEFGENSTQPDSDNESTLTGIEYDAEQDAYFKKMAKKAAEEDSEAISTAVDHSEIRI